MDKIQEVIKSSNLDELVFYIDYVEMILDLVEKRQLRDPELELEHSMLKSRYNELVKIK